MLELNSRILVLIESPYGPPIMPNADLLIRHHSLPNVPRKSHSLCFLFLDQTDASQAPVNASFTCCQCFSIVLGSSSISCSAMKRFLSYIWKSACFSLMVSHDTL